MGNLPYYNGIAHITITMDIRGFTGKEINDMREAYMSQKPIIFKGRKAIVTNFVDEFTPEYIESFIELREC